MLPCQNRFQILEKERKSFKVHSSPEEADGAEEETDVTEEVIDGTEEGTDGDDGGKGGGRKRWWKWVCKDRRF